MSLRCSHMILICWWCRARCCFSLSWSVFGFILFDTVTGALILGTNWVFRILSLVRKWDFMPLTVLAVLSQIGLKRWKISGRKKWVWAGVFVSWRLGLEMELCGFFWSRKDASPILLELGVLQLGFCRVCFPAAIVVASRLLVCDFWVLIELLLELEKEELPLMTRWGASLLCYLFHGLVWPMLELFRQCDVNLVQTFCYSQTPWRQNKNIQNGWSGRQRTGLNVFCGREEWRSWGERCREKPGRSWQCQSTHQPLRWWIFSYLASIFHLK